MKDLSQILMPSYFLFGLPMHQSSFFWSLAGNYGTMFHCPMQLMISVHMVSEEVKSSCLIIFCLIADAPIFTQKFKYQVGIDSSLNTVASTVSST
ncbi:hypothetical protein CEXT_769871 [Caerostris extrusa]|uniref:Uncharacterized protein n=1 Tax=Caerostris extrusa TaxID=172846 RepID=A0AAV4YEY5_CAEEX|nr:hypothetical protein CEXT_769871 [Caerostris extrusa]